MPRPKHPKPELEALICSLEQQQWVVERGTKYYRAKCPPPHRQCMKWIKITPSDPNYTRNLRGWFKRSGCWKEDL